jgi:hypothetical protein
MIRYFVAYSCSDPYTGALGFGHAEINLTDPIRDIHGVRAAAAAIERSGGHKVTVLNWRRFEEPEAGQ